MTILKIFILSVLFDKIFSYSEEAVEPKKNIFYSDKNFFFDAKKLNGQFNRSTAAKISSPRLKYMKLTSIDEHYFETNYYNSIQDCNDGLLFKKDFISVNKCMRFREEGSGDTMRSVREQMTTGFDGAVSLGFQEFTTSDCTGAPVNTDCNFQYFDCQNFPVKNNVQLNSCQTLSDSSTQVVKYQLSTKYPIRIPQENSPGKYYSESSYTDAICSASSMTNSHSFLLNECVSFKSRYDDTLMSYVQTARPDLMNTNGNSFELHYQEFDSPDCTGVGNGCGQYSTNPNGCSSGNGLEVDACVPRDDRYILTKFLDIPPMLPEGFVEWSHHDTQERCQNFTSPLRSSATKNCIPQNWMTPGTYGAFMCINYEVSIKMYTDDKCQVELIDPLYSSVNVGRSCDFFGGEYQSNSACRASVPVVETTGPVYHEICLSQNCLVQYPIRIKSLKPNRKGCKDWSQGDKQLVVDGVSFYEDNYGNNSIVANVTISRPQQSSQTMRVVVVAKSSTTVRSKLNTVKEFTIPAGVKHMLLSVTSAVKNMDEYSSMVIKFKSDKSLKVRHGCGRFELTPEVVTNML